VHTCVGEHERKECVWANVVGLMGLPYPKGKFDTCLPNNKINVGRSTLVCGLDYFRVQLPPRLFFSSFNIFCFLGLGSSLRNIM